MHQGKHGEQLLETSKPDENGLVLSMLAYNLFKKKKPSITHYEILLSATVNLDPAPFLTAAAEATVQLQQTDLTSPLVTDKWLVPNCPATTNTTQGAPARLSCVL